VERNEKYAPLLELENEALIKLQQKFEQIDFIIIDEFSLLSQIMFGKIDRRLRQAKNNNKIMGGVSILLIGDPGQLLPVAGSTLYDDRLEQDLAQTGYIAYNKFDIVVTLEEMIRQQNIENDPKQTQFMELLPRLKNGKATVDDWNFLLTRSYDIMGNLIGFENAIHIFNDNAAVDKMNLERLTEMITPIAEIKAINSSKRGLTSKSDYFGNLENNIYMSNECHINLTSNIYAKQGK
jgi:hypothetical protein